MLVEERRDRNREEERAGDEKSALPVVCRCLGLKGKKAPLLAIVPSQCLWRKQVGGEGEIWKIDLPAGASRLMVGRPHFWVSFLPKFCEKRRNKGNEGGGEVKRWKKINFLASACRLVAGRPAVWKYCQTPQRFSRS
jgi:hypothetical protein